ncbi:MAG: outer membrane beta-barrel protein [Microscillaceae bacterium]|nr:outer membrane beta-barrel protein [Microscillaceae bacterium]
MQKLINFIYKLLLSAIFVFAFSSLSKAQVGIHLGGGLIYGTEVEQLGLNGRATFRFGNWRIAPGVDYFFPEKSGGLKVTVWSVNVDGNYVFDLPSGLVSPYVLAGLNFTTLTVKLDDNSLFDEDGSNTELGLNIGGGVDFNLKVVNPFIEFKYVLGEADQGVLAFGVKFGIGRK